MDSLHSSISHLHEEGQQDLPTSKVVEVNSTNEALNTLSH